MPDREKAQEVRDAWVLRNLIALCDKGWPVDGRIIVLLSLKRNKPLFEQVGRGHTDILMLETFLAKLLVQCSKQCGLSRVVNETIGFEGSEFYIGTMPSHLVGHSFYEATFYYP